jgi:hypothetical protein
MDDQNQDLECELRALKPVAPSATLWRRLETELQQSPAETRPRYRSATTLSSWKWAGWQIAAAAAAVAIVGTAAVMRMLAPPAAAPAPVVAQQAPPGRATTPAMPASDIYLPVKAENFLYDLRDEGQVMLANDQAARRTRYHYVDTYTWKNQRGNATVRWIIPREEVRFVPVSQN